MARTIWTGTIAFGLVNVPVRLATAVRDRQVHFHLLSKDGTCRLRRKLYCPESGEEYDLKQTSRGYEIAPDQYVLVRDEELKELRPEAGRTIDIVAFIDIDEVDPIYFDRTYYLLPDEGGAKAYALLVAAMAEQSNVALARFVMRQRQHLATLRVMEDRGLALHTMHFADEITAWNELESELPQTVEVKKQELEVAKQLIKALGTHFKPDEYHDEYREQLEKLIERKAAGEEISITPSADEEDIPPTYNLMEALRKSVQEVKPARTKKKPVRKRRAS